MRTGIIGTIKSLFSTPKDAGELAAAVDASQAGSVRSPEKTASTLGPSAPAQTQTSQDPLPAPPTADGQNGGEGPNADIGNW